jgi:hypothetical protein
MINARAQADRVVVRKCLAEERSELRIKLVVVNRHDELEEWIGLQTRVESHKAGVCHCRIA